MTDDEPLSAGSFSTWLVAMQRALRGEHESEVPCGGCTACCRSSQFIHVGPDETETLAAIPAELLFPAPRLPEGYVLLGYDENGHCPMLIDDECSIYEHRPRTCRTYDCRVFPATGVELDDDDMLAIARRARQWRFGFPGEVDQIEHDAVRAAATYVREHDDLLPKQVVPTNATQRAVLAIQLHDAFLRHDDQTDRRVVVDPEPEAIRVFVTSRLAPREPTRPDGAD
jgi:Fe-S-cluster containining protein